MTNNPNNKAKVNEYLQKKGIPENCYHPNNMPREYKEPLGEDERKPFFATIGCGFNNLLRMMSDVKSAIFTTFSSEQDYTKISASDDKKGKIVGCASPSERGKE